jgi:hypothetical protein
LETHPVSSHITPEEARTLLDGTIHWVNIDDVASRALRTVIAQDETITGLLEEMNQRAEWCRVAHTGPLR